MTDQTAGEWTPVDIDSMGIEELRARLHTLEDLIQASQPEMGGIAFTSMRTQTGAEVSVTGRGIDAVAAIDNLVHGVRHAMDKYRWYAGRPPKAEQPAQTKAENGNPPTGQTTPASTTPGTTTPPPTNTQPPTTTPPGTTTPPPTNTPPATASKPAGNAQPNEGDPGEPLHAIRLETTPVQGGKVTLAFFGLNRKFADIKTTRTIDSALELLAPTGAWRPEHLAAVGQHQIKWLIRWHYGKLNSQNVRYKDIDGIEIE